MKYSRKRMRNSLVLIILIIASSCSKTLIGDEGTIEEDIYLNYKTKTKLQLPFDGEWYIFNGGRTHKHGAHHFVTWGSGQRYAIDVVILEDGKSHTGEGKENEDYYCFGKPLFAPAGGVVLEIENDVEDNVPGELGETATAAGNYVLMDHLNGEYSLIAHFKKGSVLVAVGDTIAPGQELGLTGNSGNSTEPHLHYHMQNSPQLLNSTGLPAQFQNYYVNGVFTERAEPERAQFVKK